MKSFLQYITDEETPNDDTPKRDYKREYEKFQSSDKMKKYRAELNRYNRRKGTYGNGDGLDASHSGGEIAGFEDSSKNKGREEGSRVKGSHRAQEGGFLNGAPHEEGGIPIEAEGGEFITSVEATEILGADKLDAANNNPEDYEIIHKNELAEYGGLVEKNNINRSAIDMLEYIDKYGDLPMNDARNRSKK